MSELHALLEQPPGQTLAFVRGRVRLDDLAQTFVALANAHGGMVVLGVHGRKVEGVADAAAAHELALDAAAACTPPLVLPLPRSARAEERTVLLLTVPAGLSHVYSLHGKYLRRVGAEDQPLPPDALRRLLLERGETSWERLAPQAAVADLDLAKIRAYVQRVGAVAEHDPLGFLWRRGALARSDAAPIDVGQTHAPSQPVAFRPTNAGLLLFASAVERHFPQCEITLVRYAGREMSDSFAREDIRDTLPEAVRRAEIWLTEHLRRGSRLVGLERQDWVQLPNGAVREVLVNAVAHRDYSVRGEGVRIALFSDRLECYSPGRLPGHVTLDNLVHERFSRNETLVQVLSDFGLIERLGYGIDRVLRQMAEAGLPPPEFRETAAGFLVTLHGQHDDQAEPVGVETDAWLRLGLNERQIAALTQLAAQHRLGSRDLQDLFPEVSAETLRRDLADLVDRGLLLRVGEKRGTYYILR